MADMVLLLALNVALFLPVFTCFGLIMWFGCMRRTKDDRGGPPGSDGGAGDTPPEPFSGPGSPSRIVYVEPNDLARSA